MKHAALWVAVAATICLPVANAQTIQVDKNNRTIAITATDKASAEADIATVTVGFQIYAPDAPAAYSQGSQLSNAIMAALKKDGVPDKAIESQDQKLGYTEFSDSDKSTPAQRAQKLFTLSQSWMVTVPAKDAASILHVAVSAGANDSGNIYWDLSTREDLQAKAAAKALEHARRIADQMAAGLNAHLGPLVYASNQTPVQRFVTTVNAEMASTIGAPPPAPPVPLAIRPQQVEESATVYAVFAIE
ncbi:MAG TPA: SIMPL domain-containing protein [Acidobacteriaceae bacterium]|nr:SIMPL domain-containing protein [Acidobacteriaceae bacterium]